MARRAMTLAELCALIEKHGSQTAAAAALGITPGGLHGRLKRAGWKPYSQASMCMARVAEAVRKHGTHSAAARALGRSRQAVHAAMKRHEQRIRKGHAREEIWSDSYYVISNCDGEVSIGGPVTRDELTRRIDRGDYGDDPQWLHVIPDDLQTMGSACVIIRGTIVAPRSRRP